MAIIIDDPEFEAILAEVSAGTGRGGSVLLIDLLKRARARLGELFVVDLAALEALAIPP